MSIRRDQDELKAHISDWVQKLSMDYVEEKKCGLDVLRVIGLCFVSLQSVYTLWPAHLVPPIAKELIDL